MLPQRGGSDPGEHDTPPRAEQSAMRPELDMRGLKEMTSFRTIAAAAAGGLIGCAVLTVSALAQATCDWYARTALQQQKLNLDRKCGFNGPSWSLDRNAHMAWCASVSPTEWRRQAQFRDQELSKCASKK
jgi:hypothetical protein